MKYRISNAGNVKLTLTPWEAEVIYTVMCHTGGSGPAAAVCYDATSTLEEALAEFGIGPEAYMDDPMLKARLWDNLGDWIEPGLRFEDDDSEELEWE